MSDAALGRKPDFTLLDRIDSPEQLRQLRVRQLPELCSELREYLIDTVSKNSGHFASGLGAVDLAVALHYVFHTPEDKLVWDVGHQAYPHKILTGHKRELGTIRKKNGLHAFIWRGETPYDLLSTGHASTSIGSALGLAVAERELGSKHKVVAVIGDGSMSGGAAFEAMNHAGSFKDLDLLVILNDNEMSISENVGRLAQLLSQLLSNPHYAKLIAGGGKVLSKLPAVREFAMRAQEHVKGMLMPGTLFEELGFNYIGPVNGNDVTGLVSILRNLRATHGLQLLHVITRKGKGYAPAEQDPCGYHGVPCFDRKAGIVPSTRTSLTFSDGFGRWLCDMAAIDDKLCGITPAMKIGSCMEQFAERYPRRFFDVAIAEQHSLIFASGLAAGGMKPVVAIYSSFLQRAYDGVIHDDAIQDLPILMAIDRAGVVGPDGPTHQGAFDIAFLRTIPNLVIMAPCDLQEQYRMLTTGFRLGHPAAVRFPRAAALGSLDGVTLQDTIPVGRGEVVTHGRKVVIMGFGPCVHELEALCARRGWTLCNMRFIKPLDQALVLHMLKSHDLAVTVEEGAVAGGIGEEIASICAREALPCRVMTLGLPDRFLHEDSRNGTLHDLQLDPEGIEAQIDAKLE